MSVKYQSQQPVLQFLDLYNVPLAYGSLKVYQHDTTTLATLYSDKDLSVEVDNPATLDSYGVVDNLYVPFNNSYDIVVTAADGTIQYQAINIGNLDLNVVDRDSSVITADTTRTLILDNSDAYIQTITTATNTDLTISPGAGGYTQFSKGWVQVTGSLKTSTYSFVSNAATDPYVANVTSSAYQKPTPPPPEYFSTYPYFN